MRYFAGVDGGGSKTYSLVVDEAGNVLGSGLAGCGNHQIIGAEAAVTNISESLHEALRQADLKEEKLSFVQFGLAGADRPFDMNRLQPEISRQMNLQQTDIVCDTMEGLRVGSPTNTGVVLVCGSNTNAAGRNEKGQTVQVGGFNDLFGDRAGGYHLAFQAFSRTVRCWDGREPHSILVDKVPAALGFDSMETMIERCLDDEIVEAPLQLSYVVHEAAREGDWLSIELLTNMGRELGLAAAAVIHKLGGFSGHIVPVVLTGSILQSGRNPELLEALKKEVSATHASCTFVIPQLVPVFGSVMLAMDRLGIAVTEQIAEKFTNFGG
ncbi:N-acetylglucosamine kinase [Cohnella phaseoli]|uniref:N-acetylglucosamine kinase-like BadF-type ATPase n=1 Tax=Cohnella phaseoli TaxID=456490 RepID=A0A3D9IS37_9BACL|nr:BadF/BadG/BcrA/BcrD ATPase family protein [Cohnella phaseoli]RED64574.1 N-acetylglucosamine kinase-like BadF-type ATPase [Cohnella phaseoli]